VHEELAVAEGHSVVRWARALGSLVGEEVVSLDLPKRWLDRKRFLLGRQVRAVEARGKHLLLHFDTGYVIHTHAMMYGSWQFGSPGMALRKPEKNVRLRLVASRLEAVFFNGPIVEVLSPEEFASHPKLKALGPDVLDAGFDRVEAWRRMQRNRDREIGDALIDQTIVCGVGNIFKSESLFLAKIHPQRPVGSLEKNELEVLWRMLIPIMKKAARNSGPITTLPAHLRKDRERNWVYSRSSRSCFLCGAIVRMIRQGELKRTTYFCPACQR
jgi:endonuclease VIII